MKRVVLALVALGVLSNANAGGHIIENIGGVESVEQESLFSNSFYVGMGIGIGSLRSYDYDTNNIVDTYLKFGYDYNDYIGIEARVAKGLTSGDELKHNYSYGVYLKPQYPISEQVKVYGLLGYATSKMTYEFEEKEVGISNNYTKQSQFSYGVGVDYKFDKDWSVSLDAVKYIDKSTKKAEGKYLIDIDSITVGITNHF